MADRHALEVAVAEAFPRKKSWVENFDSPAEVMAWWLARDGSHKADTDQLKFGETEDDEGCATFA